jgi:hypothetical protein
MNPCFLEIVSRVGQGYPLLLAEGHGQSKSESSYVAFMATGRGFERGGKYIRGVIHFEEILVDFLPVYSGLRKLL